MNKRFATFIAIYLIKIGLLAIVLYGISWISLGIHLFLGGTPISDDETNLIMAIMSLIAVMMYGNWLVSHKDEVDKYYDEKDRG